MLAASSFLNPVLHGIIIEDERGLTALSFRCTTQDSASGGRKPCVAACQVGGLFESC